MNFGKFRTPKNNDKYFWTLHSIEKMKFYGLSEQKILGVIRRPQRKEEGIVKNTTAVMQPISPKTDKDGKTIWKTEIWVMYQTRGAGNSKPQITNHKHLAYLPTGQAGRQAGISNLKFKKLQNLLNPNKLKIISAWRYPGVSPEKNPIPQDILREIEEGDLESE
jgi:hypothetical protein